MITITPPAQLSIQTPIDGAPCYNFSETNLWNIPKNEFVLSSGSGSAVFANYAKTLLLTLIQHMLLRRVLLGTLSLKEYSIFGVVYFHKYICQLTINAEHEIDTGSYCWLEHTILETVRENEGFKLSYIMYQLCEKIIGSGKSKNPGAKLIMRIIEQQKRQLVTTSTTSDILFNTVVIVHFPETYDLSLNDEINRAIEFELVYNKAFAIITKELDWELCKAIDARTFDND